MQMRDGARAQLTTRHGPFTGVLRSFDVDGETRWELVLDETDNEFFGPGKTHEAVGLLSPEDVAEIDA